MFEKDLPFKDTTQSNNSAHSAAGIFLAIGWNAQLVQPAPSLTIRKTLPCISDTHLCFASRGLCNCSTTALRHVKIRFLTAQVFSNNFWLSFRCRCKMLIISKLKRPLSVLLLSSGLGKNNVFVFYTICRLSEIGTFPGKQKWRDNLRGSSINTCTAF